MFMLRSFALRKYCKAYSQQINIHITTANPVANPWNVVEENNT